MNPMSYSTLTLNVLIFLSILLIILYHKWCYNYWKRKKIPFLTPTIPFGNINKYHKFTAMHEALEYVYNEMKPHGHKHCGLYIFTRPIYLVLDPEYIKAIMTKDFAHFQDRGIYHNEKDDPINCHILVLEGEKWKRLRTKFTPTFTTGKMKMMFDGLLNCADQMLEAVHKIGDKPVDIKEICACFTTDVIGSCVFGIDCNSFDEKQSEFRRYGRRLFQITLSLYLRTVFGSMYKNLAKFLRLKLVEPEISSFFINVTETILKYREEKGVIRNDFLQLLMEMRREDREGLSVNEIAAQSFLFFAAGFETSSITMTFCVYELAQNTQIQEKVRTEIEEIIAKYNGKLTYEAVLEMKYLNQVVEETMRKHPSVPTIPRVCTEDYKVPDGESYIERGTHVFIPVYSLHRDPEYFPDPEKFDPDRFTEENKAKRHPYTYLPFGEGPRICLGQRFGLLQVKIGLITLLRNYSFSPNPKSTYPLNYNKISLFLTVKDPVWLNATRIGKINQD